MQQNGQNTDQATLIKHGNIAARAIELMELSEWRHTR